MSIIGRKIFKRYLVGGHHSVIECRVIGGSGRLVRVPHGYGYATRGYAPPSHGYPGYWIC